MSGWFNQLENGERFFPSEISASEILVDEQIIEIVEPEACPYCPAWVSTCTWCGRRR